MKTKFVIYAYSQQASGGSLALHVLCRMLTERGYDARIFEIRKQYPISKNPTLCSARHIWHIAKTQFRIFKSRHPRLFGKKSRTLPKPAFFPYKRYLFPFIVDKKNTIVVYPEVIYGNPLRARHVIRYMLYFGEKEITDSYLPTDMRINYQQKFATEGVSIGAPTVCLTYINQTYKRTHFGKRKGRCYILRKGRDFVNPEDLKPGTIIDKLSDEEICRVFNDCKYCISFDQDTYYTLYAIKCGCIPIIVPRPGQTKEDWYPMPSSRWGKAFGFTPSEIKHAIQTAPMKLKHMEEFENRNQQAMDNFINSCIKFFHLS